jgi:hypothetical protein
MKKRTIKNLMLSMLGVFLFHACTSDFIVPDVTPLPPGTEVTLSGDVQPIFTDKCIGCHAPGITNPDLTTGHSYNSLWSNNLVDTVNPTQSILYLKINTGGSMAGFCNATQVQTVLEWIKQGAKDN